MLSRLDKALQFLGQNLHRLIIYLGQVLPHLGIPAVLRVLSVCLQTFQLLVEYSDNVVHFVTDRRTDPLHLTLYLALHLALSWWHLPLWHLPWALLTWRLAHRTHMLVLLLE
jgi:hypothetical protein